MHSSTVLKASPFLRLVCSPGGRTFAYHALFNHYRILNKEAVEVLKIFSDPVDKEELLSAVPALTDLVSDFQSADLIGPIGCDERSVLEKHRTIADRKDSVRAVDSIGLTLTHACNLECSYCLSNHLLDVSGARVLGQSNNMQLSTAFDAIDVFASMLDRYGSDRLLVNFNGGEPLLRWKEMKQIINYCKEIHDRKFKVGFSVNTNAVLMTEIIGREMYQENVDISSSLDGTRLVNDRVRCRKGGASAFDDIFRGLELVFKYSRKDRGLYTTLCDENIDFIDEKYLDFCADTLQLKFLHVEPDIVNLLEHDVESIVDRMSLILEQARKRGIIVRSFVFRPFLSLFTDSLRNIGRTWCIPAAGTAVNVLPSGQINRCVYSTRTYGHYSYMEEIITSPEWSRFSRSRSLGNVRHCTDCEIEGACVGGCFLTEESAEFMGQQKIVECRCNLYRLMTRRLLQCWLDDKELIDGIGWPISVDAKVST